MRFEEKEDHHLDTKTGLKWSKENFGPMSWEDAMVSLPEGWRLPTIEELFLIVDYSKSNPSTELPGIISSSNYWSSTTYASYSVYACYVNFYSGHYLGYYSNKSNAYYIRAVRGS